MAWKPKSGFLSRRFSAHRDKVSGRKRPRHRQLSIGDLLEPRLLLSTNAPPLVDAGPDLVASISAPILLDGMIIDDGALGGAAQLSQAWRKVRGPGDVAFENPAATDTLATFSTFGTYLLRLEANDGQFTSVDYVTVKVNAANQAPAVNAGVDQTVALGTGVVLTGTITDDQPLESVLSTWTAVSGPGLPELSNPGEANTSAHFDKPGTYVLRLEAHDGQYSATDEVTIIVVAESQTQVGIDPIVIEAESAKLSDTLLPHADSTASGNAYIATNVANQGQANFTFQIQQAGDYVIWAKILAPTPNADSFNISLDGGTEDVFDAAEGTWSNTWQWIKVNGRAGTGTPLTLNPRVFNLTEGSHTLTFRGRESNTGLDRIVITNETDFDPNNLPNEVPINHVPLADAGLDQSVSVSDSVLLHGSATDDGLPNPSAALTTKWVVVGGSPANVTFDAPNNLDAIAHFSQSGQYVLQFQVSDGALSGTDEVTITVLDAPPPPKPQVVVAIEAEAGTLLAPISVRSDSAATGGQFVATSTADQGAVTINFNVAKPGTYVIWAKVKATSPNQDSFYVSVDGGAEDVFDAAEGRWSDSWQWTAVNGRGALGTPLALAPRVFTLSAGSHTVTFRGREAGTGLDQVFITDDFAFAPNQAPHVNAGNDSTVTVNATIALQGVVTDDSLPNPPAHVTMTWTVVSGPQDGARIVNPSVANAQATFSQVGTYVLQLAANDSESTATDQVTIVVSDPSVVAVQGFFVSPNGSAQGDGSADHPWDLKTALAQPAAVKPGDTIWLRGGTYRGGVISKLTGTATKPIVVRAYPGERVTIDTYSGDPNASNSSMMFHVEGAYTTFWGLEVMSSNPSSRVSAQVWPNTADQNRGSFEVLGSNIKFINLIVHDLREGFGFWSSATGGEIYGTIIYNNGWTDAIRGNGHGIYTQNESGIKRFADNVIFNQFGEGIDVYGSSAAKLNGFNIEGNTIFDNGAGAGVGYDSTRSILIGGDAPADNIRLAENVTYDAGSNGRVWFGYHVSNGKLTLQNNYFVDTVNFQQPWSSITATNNRVVGSITGGSIPSGVSTVNRSGKEVFIQPNEYEQGRANITVINWDKAASVNADLSAVLAVGATYEIHHVYDLFGAPVISGIYDGKPIALPLRNLTAPKPIGGSNPISLSSEFGVFLVTTTAPASAHLLAADGAKAPLAAGNVLKPLDLEAIKQQAISEWSAGGADHATIELLSNTKFQIADVGGAVLGQASGQTVTLDDNAAGFGWFIDPTPAKNEEFVMGKGSALQAIPGSAAEHRIDLLTVMLHELGHVAGLEHSDASAGDQLMSETLPTGARKVLEPNSVDAALNLLSIERP